MAEAERLPDSTPWDVYTNRAVQYAQYRLEYAPEATTDLATQISLERQHVVADIGSGTGKLSQHFLNRVKRVYCVEPNRAMRIEAETRYSGHPAYVSIPACAETTTLPDTSVDLIVMGMADDWFDPPKALAEFRRILVPTGWLATYRYRLSQQYIQRLAPYLHSNNTFKTPPKPGKIDPTLYFAPGYQVYNYNCSCDETWEQFIGGAVSAAGAPVPGDLSYHDFCRIHQKAFSAMSENGLLHVDYICTVTLGRLRQPEIAG